MISLVTAVKAAGRMATIPHCANMNCPAPAWQLWSRRSRGAYLNDEWYCCDECLLPALTSLVVGLPSHAPDPQSRAHRLPLGLLMLSRGAIDEEQLRAALTIHKSSSRMKIGECLQKLGIVTDDDVARAVGAQQSLPVLAAMKPEPDAAIPLSLLRWSSCVAFRGNFHPSILYVGFDGDIDRSLLSAAEFILGRQCEPCIVATPTVKQCLERRVGDPLEVAFSAVSSVAEILRTIASYAQQVRADRIRLASTRHHLWVHLDGSRSMNLTFRLA